MDLINHVLALFGVAASCWLLSRSPPQGKYRPDLQQQVAHELLNR